MKSKSRRVGDLIGWCQNNNLVIKVSITKELFVDFRKKHLRFHEPVTIDGKLKRVNSFRFLREHISEDLSCAQHIDAIPKKT